MDGLALADLLVVSLQARTGADRGVPLAEVLDTIAGSDERLSRQVEVAVAVERLVEEGLVRRENGDGDRLGLTPAGESRAAELSDRLAECRIELVAGEERRELTVEAAAAELDRSPVAIAADCTDDGVYYDRQRVDRDELVDRVDERDAFAGAIARVAETGHGETVRVVGPSGSGKTTLVGALLAERADSVEAVETTCRETGSGPFQPVRDALEAVATPVDLDPTDFDVDDTESFRAQQTGLFAEITGYLAPESGVRALFFDDVDHADPATWSYLRYLAERVTDHPLILVLAHRPGTLPEDAPVHPDAGLDEQRLELSGLDRESTAQLVEQVVGRRGAPDEFVDAVYERTGGMPLYVETTVETLLETGRLDPQFQWYPTGPDEFDLPDEVRETIQRQVATLEPDVREILEWVAITHGFVPLSVLETVADLPPARLETVVRTATRTGTLRRSTRDGVAYVTVRNDVFGDALVDRLSEAERERRHETLASAFEAAASERGEDDPKWRADMAATVAAHHERAGDPERAIEWYREAADRATDVYAHETAVDHWYDVIDVARSAGDTEALLVANERLAEVYTVVGEYDEADRHVRFVRERTGEDDTRRRQRVARLAGRIHFARSEYDDAVAVATAALDADADPSPERCRLLGVLAAAYEGTSDYDSVVETAERQRDLAADLDRPDLEAEAIHRLGQVARHRGRYDQAHDYFERSLELYRDAGDRQGEARSLNNLGIVAYRRTEFDRAREYHEESLAIRREIGDRSGQGNDRINLGNIALARDEFDRACEYYEEALATKRETGDRRGAAQSLNNLGVVAFKRCAYDRAREYYEEALAIQEAVGDRHGAGQSRNNLGLIAYRRGAVDRAREYYADSLETAREIGNRHAESESLRNLGRVAADRGEYDQAREHYEESLAIRREIGDQHGEAETLTALGRLAQDRGDRDGAREYYDQGREAAEASGFAGIAARSYCGLGDLALLCGEPELAGDHVDRARDLAADATGRTREQVRLAAARVALAGGDLETAGDRAERVREAFAERGEPRWVGRARTLLGRVAAERGDAAAARDHWTAALTALEGTGVPGETLEVLEHLVETCREHGDDGDAREWCERARAIVADAPDPVVREHQPWVETHAADLEAA